MTIPPRQEMASLPQAELARNLKSQGTTISRIFLRNFKGHADLALDMGRITVLIGPTGSGKSTVLQALNLLNSALGSDGRALLNGNIGGHGQFADIVTGRDEGLEVAIGVDGSKKAEVGARQVVSTEFSCSLALDGSPCPPGLDAVVDMRCGPPPAGAGAMRLEHSHGASRTLVSGAGTPGDGPMPAQAHGRLVPRVQADLADNPATRAFRTLFASGEYFRSLLDDLWHVPFSRVVTSDKLPLVFGASIMSQDRTRAAASLFSHISSDNPIREKISRMVEEVGHKRIETRTIPVTKGQENLPALDFVGKRSRNTIVNEGSGLNQLATMFAILAYSPRGSVVTIEEPEIHLDPAAQARLMGIMVRQAVEEGKQVVFTTHSDHLLYPLLAYVKKKDCPLACSDVSMHYFDTDESGAVAGTAKLDINEHGQIDGGLRGFWDADMKAMGEILG